MVGRGVNTVAFKKEGTLSILKLCPMFETPSFPLWIDNYLFDRDKNGLLAKHWKSLINNPENINYIVNTMSERSQVKLRQIDMFISNRNQVYVKDLYPGYKHYYCLFRTIGNAWKLSVVGSKTVKELTATGTNSSNESFIPLILVKQENGFKLLNHI